MAIAPNTMSNNTNTTTTSSTSNKDDNDDHQHDMVMPGFRFHPTEEELVEFYLRRKVEGKRFNVELITFLDLYRYDPWELPALAAIGEKEWFFYVPRDRKYRNGDRPNRVTTSGYWKATGADRMIRTETSRSIGLKKTLVFYSGKAPKGIRTSWIMNEYRLPHHETERLQKTEISLCRVYKRAGVEDHPSLPRSLPTRSRATQQLGKFHQHHQVLQSPITTNINAIEDETTNNNNDGNNNVTTVLGLSKQQQSNLYRPLPSIDEQDASTLFNSSKHLLFPLTGAGSSSSSSSVDDFHRLLNYQQPSNVVHFNDHQQQQQHLQLQLPFSPQISQPLALNTLPPTAFSDRLWEWNPVPEPSREFNDPFK